MLWIKSKSELREFLNEIKNISLSNLIFKRKYRKTDSKNRLQTTLELTVKTIYIVNQNTRSHLKEVSLIVRHSEFSTYVQPSRNTGNSPKTFVDLLKRATMN